jgi:hypothetical protein
LRLFPVDQVAGEKFVRAPFGHATVAHRNGGRLLAVNDLRAASSYFFPAVSSCWRICGSTVSFSGVKAGTTKPFASPTTAFQELNGEQGKLGGNKSGG